MKEKTSHTDSQKNKNKMKYVKDIIIVIGALAFITALVKTREDETSHTTPEYLKSISLNDKIVGVAKSRLLEIKLAHKNKWISVGGCTLKLKSGQKDLLESFEKGDSIFKNEKSDTLFTKRGNETYLWVIGPSGG
jgi:hypothetical protein